jgi:hypothetical protein
MSNMVLAQTPMLAEFLSAPPQPFAGRLNLVAVTVTEFGLSATLNMGGLLTIYVTRLKLLNLQRNFSSLIAVYGHGGHHNIT